MRLTDKYPNGRAFVTGAGSGLGRALCLCLAEAGWTLGLADVNAEALAESVVLVTAAGGTAHPVVLDVTDAGAVRTAAEAFVAVAGGVDVVVNNAGIAAAGLMEETSLEDWRAVIEINLMGVVHGCHAFVPHLKAAGAGHLINIASAAAVASGPYMAAYNTSKAGVLALSETLYTELHDTGVRVSVVLPTFFQTNIVKTQRSDAAHQRITTKLLQDSKMTAGEAAEAVLDGAGKGRLYIAFPRRARMLRHWKRLAPMHFLGSMVKVGRATERYLKRLRSS